MKLFEFDHDFAKTPINFAKVERKEEDDAGFI